MKGFRGVRPLVAVLVLAACATAGPRTFSFPSERKPLDARACTVEFLSHRGFEVVADSMGSAVDTVKAAADTSKAAVDTAKMVADTAKTVAAGKAVSAVSKAAVDSASAADTAAPDSLALPAPTVLLRRPPLSEDGTGRWWRAVVSLTRNRDGLTVVTSVLSSAERRAGPFVGPSERLAELGGELTARCMWSGGSGSSGGGSLDRPAPARQDEGPPHPGPDR